MKHKALFLDRDGTLIYDKDYLQDAEQIEFIPNIPDFLRYVQQKGILLIVVSNQSGVARGYFTEEIVQQINNAMAEKLERQYGVHLDGMYYCPHHAVHGVGIYRQDCNCRKPKPGMILQAAADFDIDLSSSLMVGDKESDRIELEELGFVRIEKDADWSADLSVLAWVDSR